MHVCSCVLQPRVPLSGGKWHAVAGALSLAFPVVEGILETSPWQSREASSFLCLTVLYSTGNAAWLIERHWVISTLLHFKIVATNSLVAVLFVSDYLGRWNSTKSKYVCNFKWYTKFSLLLFSRNPTILACISPCVQVFLEEQILTFNC